MKKIIKKHICQNCGVSYAKWQGKCSSCENWNTIVEEIISNPSDKKLNPEVPEGLLVNTNKPDTIQEITFSTQERIVCSDNELNRVLGGGIVQGSVVLVGGEPGIGKSTLLLQLAVSLKDKKVLYVSGEESAQQIKMRSSRIGNSSDQCYILNETNLDQIFNHISNLKPELLIIDSIQTLYSSYQESAVGSVSQVRACASTLMHYAKKTSTPVFLIGHITKEGTLAGPKVLEHMVDTVLQFEGDRHLSYRILRTTKNRFGSTSELGIYEMLNSGLREVNNPSEILLSQRSNNLSGIAIGAFLEGNRPLLIETQALVSRATYGTSQRSTTGFDTKRLNMLLAVLEKRAGYSLSSQDVFLNIAGGLKVEDPALDLAVCISIISSYIEFVLPNEVCFAAEVGLGGEIRAIGRIDQRISEAEKLGFNKIFISKFNSKSLNKKKFSIEVFSCNNINEVIKELKI